MRNAQPGVKDYRLSDGAGLYLVVKTNGSKLWRWSFEFQLKEKLMSYGQYPIMTLAKAREMHQEARQLKATGVDPTEAKKEPLHQGDTQAGGLMRLEWHQLERRLEHLRGGHRRSTQSRRPGSSSAAFTFHEYGRRFPLPSAVRQAANRGWMVFPVGPLAKLTANPDLLIGEATNDISLLEELASEYPECDWRVAMGPSSLCIVQLDGQVGSNSFAALRRRYEQADEASASNRQTGGTRLQC
jgi:hypothetical protein